MTQLTPQDERTLYEAGYLLLKKRKYSAAREIFEGLVAMTPGKCLPYTFLGNTYFSESRFEDAIASYRKALQMEPDNSLALAHLGEALIASQQKSEAVTTLKKAVSVDADGTGGQMAKSLLDAIDAGAFK